MLRWVSGRGSEVLATSATSPSPEYVQRSVFGVPHPQGRANGPAQASPARKGWGIRTKDQRAEGPAQVAQENLCRAFSPLVPSFTPVVPRAHRPGLTNAGPSALEETRPHPGRNMVTILPVFVAILIAVFVDEDRDEDTDEEGGTGLGTQHLCSHERERVDLASPPLARALFCPSRWTISRDDKGGRLYLPSPPSTAIVDRRRQPFSPSPDNGFSR
jgi:hypothetical protein